MGKKRHRLTVKDGRLGYHYVGKQFKNHPSTLKCIERNLPYADAVEADAIILCKQAFSARTLIQMRGNTKIILKEFMSQHKVRMMKHGWEAHDEMFKIVGLRKNIKSDRTNGKVGRTPVTIVAEKLKKHFGPALSNCTLVFTHGVTPKPVAVLTNSKYLDNPSCLMIGEMFRLEFHLTNRYFTSMKNQDIIKDYTYLHEGVVYAMITVFERVQGTDYSEAFGVALNSEGVPLTYTLRRTATGDITVSPRKDLRLSDWHKEKSKDEESQVERKDSVALNIFILSTETWSV